MFIQRQILGLADNEDFEVVPGQTIWSLHDSEDGYVTLNPSVEVVRDLQGITTLPALVMPDDLAVKVMFCIEQHYVQHAQIVPAWKKGALMLTLNMLNDDPIPTQLSIYHNNPASKSDIDAELRQCWFCFSWDETARLSPSPNGLACFAHQQQRRKKRTHDEATEAGDVAAQPSQKRARRTTVGADETPAGEGTDADTMEADVMLPAGNETINNDLLQRVTSMASDISSIREAVERSELADARRDEVIAGIKSDLEEVLRLLQQGNGVGR